MDKITVKYNTLVKMVKALDRINPTDDTDVSFEYIVGSCFPDVLQNIKKAMHNQYTQGYVTGLREAKKEQQENDTQLLS